MKGSLGCSICGSTPLSLLNSTSIPSAWMLCKLKRFLHVLALSCRSKTFSITFEHLRCSRGPWRSAIVFAPQNLKVDVAAKGENVVMPTALRVPLPVLFCVFTLQLQISFLGAAVYHVARRILSITIRFSTCPGSYVTLNLSKNYLNECLKNFRTFAGMKWATKDWCSETVYLELVYESLLHSNHW